MSAAPGSTPGRGRPPRPTTRSPDTHHGDMPKTIRVDPVQCGVPGGDPAKDLTRRFYAAYRDPALAVLEGIQPARHALAFGAHLEIAVTYDRRRLRSLAERIAPESLRSIDPVLRVVDRERFRRLSQRSLSSPLLSICARPEHD